MLRNRNTCALLVGFQNGATAMENSMKSLKKLKIEPPYDQAVSLLGIYPKDWNQDLKRDAHTPCEVQNNLE